MPPVVLPVAQNIMLVHSDVSVARHAAEPNVCRTSPAVPVLLLQSPFMGALHKLHCSSELATYAPDANAANNACATCTLADSAFQHQGAGEVGHCCAGDIQMDLLQLATMGHDEEQRETCIQK